jgi:hypothetical protein
MSPRLQRRAPPGKPDLTVESPYAPITIPPAVCLRQAPSSRASPMQPISTSTYEHTAARTRRKWGERRGGESIVAFATDTAPFSVVWDGNWSKEVPYPRMPRNPGKKTLCVERAMAVTEKFGTCCEAPRPSPAKRAVALDDAINQNRASS